ncbi:MAG: pyridoxal 5'-phosphate synthase glutaminase subunit PdxT [Acidobacteriota bacterium]|jgi:5'-phosphate synthase pdxT subunit
MVVRIGVLALQGDFAAHAAALHEAGAEALEVRTPDQVDGCAGLVLPGGESTTLLRLMEPLDDPRGMFAAIRRFHADGGALFGTCAGVILLAREVIPDQPSLGLLDARVERNAYGRQRVSFEAEAPTAEGLGDSLGPAVPMLFIRAPRIRHAGAAVEILASWQGEPVLVSQGRVLACTGHPELGGSPVVHRFFLDLVTANAMSHGELPAGLPGAACA